MRYVLTLALLILFSVPSLSLASIYQWRDDQGVIHFTDNPDRIPARYLKRVKEIESAGSEARPADASKAPQPPAAVASPAPASAPTDTVSAARAADRERIAAELKRVEEGLVDKRKELNRLHHKWSVAKGRTPTPEEVKKFEKKRAEGKATFQDNPYVNKKPLSSSAPARVAYYRKLEEVRQDEERVRQLARELQGL